MRHLRQVAIVFAICLLCEGIVTFFPFPFPGSVFAMLVTLVLFFTKCLKLDDIKDVSSLLLNNMTLVFIPPFISVINYLDLLQSIIIQFLVIVFVSTLVTFLVASTVVTLVVNLQNKLTAKKEVGSDDC